MKRNVRGKSLDWVKSISGKHHKLISDKMMILDTGRNTKHVQFCDYNSKRTYNNYRNGEPLFKYRNINLHKNWE